ncbi:hypothetical protein [Citrobacter freundii complex sp. 2024EL-00748]|uniref:hypothetical protein n=1 Tax=Citrobacter freundii complex sp. 2024EL-00748 TaxID=3382813 RepID=UPI00345B5CED
MEQVKYQIPGATGISLQLQMITLLGDAAAAGFTINLFNAQPIMSWPEPGCMALVMVLMKNTLMRIAVLSANCQSGTWKSSQVKFTTQVYNIGQNVVDQYIGIHAYCSWTYLFSAPLGGTQKVYSDGNNGWRVTNTPYNGFQTGSTVSVTCLNLPGAGI